jgi:hypothetical protein
MAGGWDMEIDDATRVYDALEVGREVLARLRRLRERWMDEALAEPDDHTRAMILRHAREIWQIENQT